MPRKKTASPAPEETSFEESIAELEAIVAAMEEESLPLEELVAKYEQGTRLLGRCEEVLNSARKRLKTIASRSREADSETPDDTGNPLTDDASADTDLSDDDDDIRLF